MSNSNHPRKGSGIKVEPIRDRKDIALIKKILAGRPLDLAMFVVGINTNLRASDLLNITIDQVRGLRPGESFELREKKTGKQRRVTMNAACVNAIKPLIEKNSLQKAGPESGMLFVGQRGPVTVPGLSKKVKVWCQEAKLKGNYAAHTLRKTWGYHQRVTFGVDLPTLMECFNHSTQKQTLAYLCIQPEEIKSAFMNEL